MATKPSPNLDLDFGLDILDVMDTAGTLKAAKEIHEATEIEFDATAKQSRRSTIIKRYTKHIYRRAFSETQLLDLMGNEPFRDGWSYNFITGGDVDSLSFLKLILRQHKLDHVLFSTWCMAQEDIFQFMDWHEEGKIGRVDAYVGEIFPGTYKMEYAMLKPFVEKTGGRIAVLRNHSKIYAGHGDGFYFGIQTSANINTNPRIENACITIDRGLYEFYRDFFDGLESYVRENDKES